MSGTISYKIGGKYDSKGEKEAIAGIGQITKAAKAFNLVVGGFVIGKVIQGIGKVVSGSTEEFNKNKDAETKLFQSLGNNSKLAGTSFDQMRISAEKFSSTSIFDNADIENQQAFLSNLKLNKSQIDETTQAAIDLAAAGVMPLDAATKALGESYGGNVGQLKKLCPEIGNLTAKQLANGEAVKLLEKNYKGMGAAMTETFSGRDKQFSNAFGDLKSSFGAIGESFKFLGEGKLLQPVKELTDFVNNHQKEIINFFLQLPEIAKISFQTIGEVFQRTFSGDNFLLLLKNLGSILLSVVKTLLSGVWDLLTSLADSIAAPFVVAVTNIGANIQNIFAKLHNGILTKIEELANSPFISKIRELLGDVSKVSFQKVNENNKGISWKEEGSFLADKWKSVATDFIDNCKNIATTAIDNQKEINDRYSDIFDKAGKKIGTVLTKDLPKDLQKALSVGSGVSAGSSAGNDISDKISSLMEKVGSSVTSSLGQVGSMISAIAQSKSPLEAVIQVIIQIVAAFIQAAAKIEVVGEVLNFLDTIFGQTVSVIKNDLIDTFAPVVQNLKQIGTVIGNILGPALEVMAPLLQQTCNLCGSVMSVIGGIIKFVFEFIGVIGKLDPILNICIGIFSFLANIIADFYNYIMMPFINFCLKGICAAGNFFIGIYNKIASCLNSISIFGWHPFNLGSKAELNYDQMALQAIDTSSFNTSASTNTDNNTSSGTASYTAAKDTTVYITFDHSFVNGDAQAIAIQIKKEIQSAEKLGYC